jgi:hypothetical protein
MVERLLVDALGLGTRLKTRIGTGIRDDSEIDEGY